MLRSRPTVKPASLTARTVPPVPRTFRSDWRKEGIETILKDSYTLNASGSYGDGGATKVSCKITVNGETVSENQASGTYSTVSCHIPYSYVPKQ